MPANILTLTPLRSLLAGGHAGVDTATPPGASEEEIKERRMLLHLPATFQDCNGRADMHNQSFTSHRLAQRTFERTHCEGVSNQAGRC